MKKEEEEEEEEEELEEEEGGMGVVAMGTLRHQMSAGVYYVTQLDSETQQETRSVTHCHTSEALEILAPGACIL